MFKNAAEDVDGEAWKRDVMLVPTCLNSVVSELWGSLPSRGRLNRLRRDILEAEKLNNEGRTEWE